MIEVEYLVEGPSPKMDAIEWTKQIVESVRSQMDIPPELVRSLIVADEARFGEAVGRFDPTREYTKGNGLVAAGKTFAHRGKSGRGPSTILMLDTVLVPALVAAHELGPDASSWPAADQQCLYVLFHEFGHCIDNIMRRRINFEGSLVDRLGHGTRGLSLHAISAHHFDLVLSEFAACAFAKDGYNDAVQQLDIATNNGAVADGMNRLAQLIAVRPIDVDVVFREALADVWFVMIQHAKLIGSTLDPNRPTPLSAASLWTCAKLSTVVADALDSFAGYLQRIWAQYPEWTDDHLGPAKDSALKLAAGLGFRFEENGVWWDRLLLDALTHRLEASEQKPN